MANEHLRHFWKQYTDNGHRVIILHPMELNRMGEMSCTCNRPGCKAAGKHPTDNRWQDKRALPETYLTRNITNRMTTFGVSAETLLIVDVDPRNGGLTGLKNLEDALDMNLEDEAGLTVRTGGGGYHFYFTAPEGVRMVTALKQFKGVDFIHGMHYVVGLGSAHKSGGTYEAHKGSVEQIGAPPAELVELITRKPWEASQWDSSDEVSPEMVRDALQFIPNDDLDYDAWLRIGMALRHWNEEAGYALFMEWSALSSKFDEMDADRRWSSFGSHGELGVGTILYQAGENGWEKPQPPATMEADGSAWKPGERELAGIERMRAMFDGQQFEPLVVHEDEIIELPQVMPAARAQTAPAAPRRDFWQLSDGSRSTGANPFETPAPPASPPKPKSLSANFKIELPGWMGTIYDYIFRTAMSPQPGAIASAALQIVSIAGWGCKMYNGASPNLLTFVIAESATGKEHPQSVLSSLLRGVLGVTIENDMRSDKDLIMGLVNGNGRGAYMVDEAHTLMAAIGNDRAVHMQQLGGQILKISTATELHLPNKWREELCYVADDKIVKAKNKIERLKKGGGKIYGNSQLFGGGESRSAQQQLSDAKQRLLELEMEAARVGSEQDMSFEARAELAELPAEILLNEELLRLLAVIEHQKERARRARDGFDSLRFNMMMSSTPRNFNKYINQDAIEGGLAGRSIIFDCGGFIPDQCEEKPPEDEVTRKSIEAFLRDLRTMADLTEPQVTVDEDARQFFKELYHRYNSTEMREDGDIGAVNRRVRERAFAVASTIALGCPMVNGEFTITRSIAETALSLCEMSTSNVSSLLKQTTVEDGGQKKKIDGMDASILQTLKTSTQEKPVIRSGLRQRSCTSKVGMRKLNKEMSHGKDGGEDDFWSQRITALINMGMIGKTEGGRGVPAYWITDKGRSREGYDKSL